MKNVDIFAIKGITKKDDRSIMNHNNQSIEMTIDEYGRVYNEGGQYIANAEEVEPGFGVGCHPHGGKRAGSGRKEVENLRKPHSIKFTDAEWEQLKKQADNVSLTASEYVRRLTLRGYIS